MIQRQPQLNAIICDTHRPKRIETTYLLEKSHGERKIRDGAPLFVQHDKRSQKRSSNQGKAFSIARTAHVCFLLRSSFCHLLFFSFIPLNPPRTVTPWPGNCVRTMLWSSRLRNKAGRSTRFRWWSKVSQGVYTSPPRFTFAVLT